MGNTGVIDHFLEVFTRYIDSGFGLLSGEVAFIATTLIVIDVTLAALFWSWGADDDILARLVKKTLFVGVFAYIIGNWNNLARIIFESFAGLGLKASGTGFTTADLLRPGKVAQTGLDAGRPLLDSISSLMGYWSFFENFIQIACMFLAWALVLLAFFILAIQLFVTLIEFKLTTLAGFVLIPFGLFGKSAFMAERVLGNVISSGIKVLVLAVIIGIGSTLFSEFTSGFGGQNPRLMKRWRSCWPLCRCSVLASSVPASPAGSSQAVLNSAPAPPSGRALPPVAWSLSAPAPSARPHPAVPHWLVAPPPPLGAAPRSRVAHRPHTALAQPDSPVQPASLPGSAGSPAPAAAPPCRRCAVPRRALPKACVPASALAARRHSKPQAELPPWARSAVMPPATEQRPRALAALRPGRNACGAPNT
jgi:P-type conjugative transfer protein TrbL